MSTEEANLRTITDTQETTTVKREAMMEPLEPPVVPERRPEITSHVVDDVFLRTITEKKTFEDIERHRRQVKESHAKPPPANPKWDVVIRNYPAPEAEMLPEPTTDWESYSETSSASGYPITPVLERPLERHITERHVAQQNLLSEQHRSSVDIERTYRSSLTIPPPDPAPPNWDVLIRVLDQPEQEPIKDVDDLSTSEIAEESTLTTEDKEKWRQIITTESMLRSMLTEATVKEDYERIRRDRRYEKLFEPAKWDVIIRVLTPPERLYDSKGGPANQRYRRKTDWDTRSRRSSLPTLYEYDSDGTSSARTLTTTGALDLARSRRTSRSSMRSDMDVRSMTEVMVDYSRPDKADTLSDVSGPGSFYRGVARKFYDDDDLGHMASEEDDYGPVGLGLARSLSQPSLARSASEFTEHWAVVRGQSPTSPRSSAHSSRGPAPLPPIQPLRSSELFAEQSSSSQQETSGAAHMRSFQSSYQTREQRGWFESDNRSEEGFK